MAKEIYSRVNPRNINKERIYMVMDKADMLEAMKVMPDRTFKVFMYLMSNQDGWSSNHARKAVSDNTGYDKSTVCKIFKQLKELGYIVEVDGTEIIYSYSTTKGRPEAYSEPHVEGVNNWTEADKAKYQTKVVARETTPSCSTVNYDIDDSCSTDNYDDIEVALQSTLSCSTDHTNTTYITSTTTVDAAEEIEYEVAAETTTAAAHIVYAASEDATASSGMSEQELRAYFRTQGNIKKRIVKDSYQPWIKFGDGAYDELTALQLWNRVKDMYEATEGRQLKSDAQTLPVVYNVWQQAALGK